MTIRFDESLREWILEDAPLLYVIGLDAQERLRTRYVGPSSRVERASGDDGLWKVPREERPFEEWWELRGDFEYPARSPYMFTETTVAVLFGPADRDLHLRYAEHDVQGERLRIRLADHHHPVAVDLHYELTPGTGVVRRWAEIRNHGDGAVRLEQAGTFAVHQPPGTYVLHHLTGDGLAELNPVEELLTPGRKVLESRRGMTGHKHQPWFALTEQGGSSVLYGALEWSGNWKLSFETDVSRAVSVVGGMSDFDFEHVLEPGATFTTPAAVVGVVEGGLDDAARSLHRFIHGSILPRRRSEATLPVIFEGWYVSFGKDTTAARLLRQVDLVADVGVELFIVTAGWYTEIQDTFDFLSHQGDWRPRQEAFPNGLEEVAEAVRARGMRFGLWWEPEAVSSDSDLFRRHPEWVFQFEHGPQPTPQGQLVLNLGRPDVYEHVRDDLFRLVEQYRLDYFRTDMNQALRAVGDPSGRSGPGRDLAWRHVRNYYRLLDEVRAAFPDLIVEDCAGGGGRIDLGVLRRTDTVWISDNTNQFVRLGMFMATTSFLPPKVCENWIVYSKHHSPDDPPFGRPEWPRHDLDFGFRVAMMGHLGISADLEAAPAEWKERARHHVARYKELRRTIQLGELHRLTPPPPRDGSGTWAAAAMVSHDLAEAVAFCYRLAADEECFRLCIPGLDPSLGYDVTVDGRDGVRRLRGAALADGGLDVVIPRRHSSALVVARRA